MSARVVIALLALTMAWGGGRASADHDVEHRIALFWQRIDSMQPGDYLLAKDLGQWALNVIERDPRARLTVSEFRTSTAMMQAGIESAGPAPIGAPQPPTHAVSLNVTTPVARGANATATATTTAGASCTITVTYASGASSAQGLGPKVANSSGAVSWTWTVGSSTTLGTWPVDVACTAPSGQSAAARATFTVQ